MTLTVNYKQGYCPKERSKYRLYEAAQAAWPVASQQRLGRKRGGGGE